MKQTGVHLAPIDEQKPISQQQQNEIIVPIAQPRPPQPKLPISDLLTGSREVYIDIGVPLYEAAIKGDWKAAEAILTKDPKLVRSSITENHETALHVAASAKRTKQVEEFVENLVKMMEEDDLELQNNSSNTALCLAAAAGNVEMVKIMVNKNKKLLTIPGSQAMMPLYMAALFGQRDMVKYLYDNSQNLSDDGWTPQNRGWLLLKCVEADLFDMALKIVQDRPELASNGNVLGVLARKPDAFIETKSNIIWRKINNLLASIGVKFGAPEKENEALQLLRIIWKDISKKPKNVIDDIIRGPPDPTKQDERPPSGKEEQALHFLKLISDNIVKMPIEIQKLIGTTSKVVTRSPSMANARKTYSSRILFLAAEMGNTKFVVELIRQYPDLIWKVNDNNQSVFHIAVKHRHQGIYNLLYEIGSML